MATPQPSGRVGGGGRSNKSNSGGRGSGGGGGGRSSGSSNTTSGGRGRGGGGRAAGDRAPSGRTANSTTSTPGRITSNTSTTPTTVNYSTAVKSHAPNKPPTKQQAKPSNNSNKKPPQPSLKQLEEAAKQLKIEQEKKRLEAKAAAAKAAAKQLQKKRDDATLQLKEAMEQLQQSLDTLKRHEQHRNVLQGDALQQFRKQFEAHKKNLKTDLKKCTTFVKKIKSGAMWTVKEQDLMNEMSSLNLTRYVEEVGANVLESPFKVSDIPMVASFCVAMHQRYPDFLTILLPKLWEGFLPGSSKTNVAEANKTKRLHIRLLTEFYLIGLLTEVKLLVKIMADATGASSSSASNNAYVVQDGNVVVAFAKSAGLEIFASTPTSVQQAMAHILAVQDEEQRTPESSGVNAESILPPTELIEASKALVEEWNSVMSERNAVCTIANDETSQLLTKYCSGAFQFLADSLIQTHNKLLKLEKRCEQDRLLSGNLPEAREKGLMDARKLKEQLEKSVEALADSLNQPVPHLEQDDDDGQVNGGGLEVWTNAGGGGDGDFGPFGDEETRDFYCNIPDLLATIPPALLGMTPDQMEKRKEENQKRYGNGNGGVESEMEEETSAGGWMPNSEAELDAVEKDSMQVETRTEVEEGDKDTPHYRLMTLLEQELPECHQRGQLDELTERFCTNHGSSKNARKRLIRTLFMVPWNRLDLLPFYSRMTATVDRIWSDVAEALVMELEQQFHGQTKFKKNQNLESRFRTARYIGELTKFRVAPPMVYLRCLRRCLDDFTGSNVDVLCCLLETAGRFVYRLNAQANSRLLALMETATRLSKAKNLDERAQSLLKAALHSVNPPPAGPRKKAKQYPPLETYLRNVFLVELEPSDASVASVSKLLMRLPWTDPSQDCGALVAKLMLKACRKGRYKTIHAIAAVAERIRTQKLAGEVTVRLIDAVLEELRWGLEHPDFRDQQRVLTYARLLGELYNCNQVSGLVIQQQLYDFINLGHDIPPALREASRKLVASSGVDAETSQLPVYNSATGISQTIQEDEELEESELETKVEDPSDAKPQPVAVSEHSKFDPRVPTPTDPPNSSYRIKLVCTLLEPARSIVTRANLPRLKGFLTAFQRYLFVKSTLPVEVEFALLDTFDALDSRWKQVTKGMPSSKEDGFPRYASWLDAHNATVALEESGVGMNTTKVDESEAAMDRAQFSAGASISDDESNSEFDDDESIRTESDKESVSDTPEGDLVPVEAGTAEQSVRSDDEEENSEFSDGASEDDDEEDFDEEAYMRQLEEEAFERELRKITMDALEKGKNVSRKQVAEYMPSASQISTVRKKVVDPTPAETISGVASPIPTSIFALGGKVGINFQMLKKGNKGKVEAKEIVVPVDTNLAQVASRKDEAAIRERDVIKQRVLQYEAESANAEYTGGNVYLEQEKLVKIRNRLSMEDIDKNFGTNGGNLRQNAPDKAKPSVVPTHPPGRGSGRGGPGRGGRGGGRNTGGRSLVF